MSLLRESNAKAILNDSFTCMCPGKVWRPSNGQMRKDGFRYQNLDKYKCHNQTNFADGFTHSSFSGHHYNWERSGRCLERRRDEHCMPIFTNNLWSLSFQWQASMPNLYVVEEMNNTSFFNSMTCKHTHSFCRVCLPCGLTVYIALMLLL